MPLETTRGVPKAVGKYDLVEKIADGGMGSVYRGRNRETGDVVAVKVLTPNTSNSEVLLRRFEQEFKAASTLDHPNVVRALDYGQEGSVPYLVMEFVEGETLGQRIERAGRLSEAEAIRIIAQVAQGLHKAHKQGLVHRDVKPDNILVTPGGQAKLADLGLVKETEADLNLTRTGRGLGTPHFMAPEQFRNAKNADARCDIYSLGATLYMAVTGELPFRSCSPLDAWMKKVQNDLRSPRQLVPALNERIDWAVRRAMSADPESRPASCREFVEDLTGRSTRKLSPDPAGGPTPDIWYLVYTDDTGENHTVKGSLYAIRRSLKEGLLGDAANVRISRTKAGPFEPIRNQPEFRDLIIRPAPLPLAPGAGVPPGKGPLASMPPVFSRAAATASGPRAPLPAQKAPAIDIGPTRKKRQKVDWPTWLFVIGLGLAGFLFGFYFLFLRGK